MAERGPIWTEMRERLAAAAPRDLAETRLLDDLTTAAAEFMAGRIGTIARNAQPYIDEAAQQAKRQGWDEGYKARGEDPKHHPNGRIRNPYREETDGN